MKITIFNGSNYEGDSQTLSLGRHDIDVLRSGIGNDRLRSIQIPPGLQARVYRDNFKVERGVLTESTPSVSAAIGATSSIVVELNPAYPFYIQAKHSQKALQAADRSQANNATVKQYTFQRQPYQQFKLEVLEDGYYKIIATHSQKVLASEDGSTDLHSKIVQQDWTNEAHQKWALEWQESDGALKITSKKGEGESRVIDISGGGMADGANAQLYTWHGKDNQRFLLISKPNLQVTNPSDKRSTSSVNLQDPAITAGSEQGVFAYFMDELLSQPVSDATSVPPGDYWIQLTTADGQTTAKKVTVPTLALPELGKQYGIYTRHNLPIGIRDNSNAEHGMLEQQAIHPTNYTQHFEFIAIEDGLFKIKNVYTGKFISADPTTNHDEGNIVLNDWQDQDYQKWNIIPGEDGKYSFTVLSNGKALDLRDAGTAEGTRIQQWTYVSNVFNQLFRLELLPPIVNLVITNPSETRQERVVDLRDPAITAGSEAGKFTYFADKALTQPIPDGQKVGPGEYWILLTTADGRTIAKKVTVPAAVLPELGKQYGIYTKRHNLPIGIKDNSTAENSTVEQQAIHPTNYTQHFEFIPVEDGWFKIKNVYSGKFLSADPETNQDEGNIFLNDWKDQDYQKWKIIPNEDGLYSFTLKSNEKALDLREGAALVGTRIQQWRYVSGVFNQLYRLEPLPEIVNLVINNPLETRLNREINLHDPAITAGSEEGRFLYFRDAALTQPIAEGQMVSPGFYWILLITADNRTIAKKVTVPVLLLPKLVITNPPMVCIGVPVDLTADAIVAGSNAGTRSYYLDKALTQAVSNPEAVEHGTYYIKLLVGGDRYSVASVAVTIFEVPQLDIHPPAPVCWDHLVDLTAKSITEGSNGTSYAYFLDPELTQPVPDPKAVGTGTYYIELTTKDGCKTSKSVQAVIKPEPVLEVADPPAVCWDKKVDLTTEGVVTAQDEGTLAYFKDEACTQAVATPTAVADGTYYVQLKVPDGCTKAKAVKATIWPEPKLVIVDPAPVCWDQKVNLTAAGVIAEQDPGQISYYQDEALTKRVADPSAVGTGTYYIRIETERGCVTKRPVKTKVMPQPILEVHDSVLEYAPDKVDLSKAIIKQDEGTITYYKDKRLRTKETAPTAVGHGVFYLQLTNKMGCKSLPKKVTAINPKPTLVVPLHLKGIHVPKKATTVGPTADFSYLPWNDGKRDYNPDYAPLGQYIETTPLQSANGRLQMGIHLHWNLPAAFSRYIKGKDGHDELPFAPVEWEVIPLAQENSGEQLKEEKVWSDYLHPEETPLNLKYAQVPLAPKAKRQPFRYMGTATPRNEQPKATEGQSPNYYRESAFLNHPLTYLGYGSMSFASFYPDCREVFGHHIPLDSEKHAGLRQVTYMVHTTLYRVEGGNYPFNQLMARLDISLEELLNQLKWPLTGGGVPKEIHLSGRVTVHTGQSTNQTVDRSTKNIQFSMGQTGTEALSAYLAAELGNEYGLRQKMEEQLEAILMGDQITGHAADLSLKFLEKRHAHGFKKLSGGHQWTIQAQRAKELQQETFGLHFLNADEKQRTIKRLAKSLFKPLLANLQQDEEVLAGFQELITRLSESSSAEILAELEGVQRPDPMPQGQQLFFDTLAKLERQVKWLDHLEQVSGKLIDLNLQQLSYEQASTQVASMKRELFGDWYKYMLAKYPPPESLEQFESSDFPPAGEVAAWLQHRAEAILTKTEATGVAKVTVAGNGKTNAIHTSSAGPVADSLVARFEAIKQVIEATPADEVRAQIVHRPAAPFYIPTDPVLLIAGLNIPEPQQGQARLAEDHYTTQRFNDNADLKELRALSATMQELGIPIAENAAWAPFILEWEAAFLPIVDRNDQNSPKNRFTLKENREETELLNAEGFKNSPAVTIRGRTFLTPGAKTRKLAALREFLALKLQLNDPAEETLAAKAQAYIDSNQRPYDTNDAVLTAARAYLRLKNEKILSQALGGLNDGMIQLEHHLQPILQDPLGTQEEQTFTEQLGQLIGRESKLAPNPAKPFLPARAGSFRLIGVRLVDTWGRYRDLLEKREFEAILSEPLFPIGSKAGWAGLPLRVTQPLRLHANWLAANKHNGQDVLLEHLPYASPIVGWVCSNPMDRSLLYFDSQGDALGYFNRQADKGAPPGKNDDFTFHNPALQHVLDHADGKPAWLQSFIDATENALAHIAPKEHHLHKSIAMLTGRPMAVVRLKISFELMGLPAHDRTWTALRDQIDRLQHHEEELHTHWQDMLFPVRLGNYMMLNDGLVGFWQEDEAGNHIGPLYTMASHTERPDILPHDKETLLWLPLNGKPVTLTLLVDPRGSVHVTTGVLPVQNLAFRKELITPALERISAWFLQAPILQPKSAKDVLKIKPAEEPGYEWKWLEAANDHHAATDDKWHEIERFELAGKKPSFDDDSELREGWLILDHE
ncbi:MAG: RICIN domain-containing protein [Bacteroidota bacterium]